MRRTELLCTITLHHNVFNRTRNKPIWKATWETVTQASQLVVDRLYQDRFTPQVILALSRGGVIPASLIHRAFSRARLDVVRLRSQWVDREHNPKAKVVVAPYDWKGLVGKRVLVVDDILDTGNSMLEVLSRLPKGLDYRVATLVTKHSAPCSHIISPYKVNPDTWVSFPWETKGD